MFGSSKGLHFLHLNIRSLLPKLDEIRLIVKESNAAIFGLTETWLDNSVSDSEVAIEGYSIVRKDRNRHGGGVCVYVRDNLTFNTRSDLDEETESVWLDLLLPRTIPVLVGVCYRPPKDSAFMDNL